MFRALLVPLDGSTFAEHALPAALGIARRAGAALHLVTVSTPLAEAYVEGLYFSAGDLEQELTTRHRSYLEATAARLRERAAVPVRTAVHHGEVAPTLCSLVEKGEADLVVMATHGRGALGRFWLGSVADEMVRHLSAPMLLVRPGEQEPDLAAEPDLSRVVVPLDGTPLAEQILEPAVALAGLMPTGEVILMRAIHAVVPVQSTPDTPEGQREARSLLRQVQGLQDKVSTDAERYLLGVSDQLRQRGLKVRTHVVIEDQPARAILEEVDRQ
jgi:nucleotide-binding universal stress UspA family protein